MAGAAALLEGDVVSSLFSASGCSIASGDAVVLTSSSAMVGVVAGQDQVSGWVATLISRGGGRDGVDQKTGDAT
jgi:hypothetical protein